MQYPSQGDTGMNRPPITPRRILIAVTVLLLIASQLPVRAATALSYVPHSFVSLISKPAALLQRLSTTIRPPRENAPDFSAAGDLADQLAQAKVYIDNLEQEIRELRNISESLAQIDALLDLGGIRLVGANVLSFNGDLKNPILTIGVGSDAGVRDGLAVVWGAGLVGRVVSTSARTADVQLITAAGTKLQVRISKPNAPGAAAPMPAFIELAEDGRSFVTEEFAVDDPVQVGDLVHLADDSWQFRARGFLVGVVTEVGESDRPLLNSRVVIRPTHSLPSLTRVAVLVPVDTQ
jgi:cell shape-determining protein MreC